ncbi:glycoside hydrolase family 97 catalytic domain-containing protein [Cellulosimicrobium terreum]|nr:glycoside hydrolase family 97 catalytic domain-containing protein [Cellulosimicrobium terreum]
MRPRTHDLPAPPLPPGTGRTARRRATGIGLALALLAPVGAGVPALAATSPTGAADAPPVAQISGEEVTSPDGSLDLTLGVVDGRLTYDVVRDGTTTVVGASGLGLALRDPDVDLTSGMTIESVERDEIDETWTPAWGTQSSVRNRANELTVHARHTSGLEIDVVARVFDDGVGFRYVLPQQPALDGPFVVTSESTEFALPADLTAYYIKAGKDWNADEKHYMTVPVGDVATAQTPITFSRADDLFLAVHEADLTDYASMTLKRVDGEPGTLVSDLIALPDGTKAVLDATEQDVVTPWRTVQVGRAAGDLAESHLVQNLNDPCAFCDVDSDGDGVDDTTDWIEPATYTGVWWELQRRDTTWNAGPKHGATTQRIKDYVDLAADAGAKYVLAEGWNTNSGGSWTNQDFVTPQADVDIDEVLAYAESKGVGFVAHNETRGYVDYYDAHMEDIFSQYEEWGVHAIKTGYATRFELGGVNRSHYDQEAVKHYQRVVDAAARHKISVNAHEAIKPTGKERTYPNMMTGEGVAGMEQQNYMGSNGNPPAQATILPFTRWIGGPADYTPGVLDVLWDPANLKTRVQTTTTTQLALYTTFYSPLQMLADTPENYGKHPEAFEYLRGMPATWDESHVDAEIGDHVTTARRSGDTWYVGVVTDENDRTLDVPLDMLDDDVTYVAEVWADAQDASWKGNPTAVEVTRSLVTSDDVLSASLVGAGGQAVRLRPATASDVAELRAYERPRVEATGAPTTSYDPQTHQVEVSLVARNDGTSVTSARVLVDGEPVDAPSARIGGGQTRELTFGVDADAIAYAPTHTVAIETGSDGGGTADDVELVPFPDAAALDAVLDTASASGDLAPSAARVLRTRVASMTDAASAGDLAGVEQAAQSVRSAVVSRDADEVGAETLDALDSAVSPWLGERVGLPALLVALRDAEASGDLDATVAAAARDALTAALRAAVRGDDDAVDRGLSRTAELLDDAAGDSATVLSETVAAQRTPLLLEAETGTLSGGAATSKEHPGYTGTGFARTLSALGAAFEVDVDTVAGTAYDVSFRYANGMVVAPLDRQLSLTVDGEAVRPLAFPNLGQDAERWRRWGLTAPARVTFGDGSGTVGLRFEAADTGNVNVDHVELSPSRGVLVSPTDEAVAVTVEVQPRCLAGKAFVAVRATNAEDVPVDLALALRTQFGDRTVADVVPGASGYQSFATRQVAVQASTATVVATGALGGEDLHAELSVEVPAIDCA